MTNKRIELPALLDKVGQHIEAALCIDDGWADRIMHMDKARKHLAAYRAAIASHDQARVVGEPVSDVTSIGAMCLILEANLIKADEYTDCAIVYKVTFDQLRNLYDQGRATNKHAVHDSDCSTNNRGCPELLGPCDCSASPPAPQEVQADWRDHVEQRIRTWRQSTMNRSGDRLAIDDFMGASEVDDLVDFVCDEYAAPVAQPATEQAEAREEQWRVVTWSSKTDRTFTKRDEALEYLRANDTDGDWHIKHVPGKKTTIYDGWFGEQAEAPSDKMSYAMLEEQNEQIRELNTSLDVECARLEKEVSVLTEMLHREVCATQPTASNAGERESELNEEIERLQTALSDLADRSIYRGNSVSFIYQKADAYKAALHRAFGALAEFGFKADGRTELCDVIRAALASKPPQGEQKRCGYCDDTGDAHSIDGEWRGRCTCPAGQSAPHPEPVAPPAREALQPYGQVTVVRRPGCVDQHWFYPWPDPPYLDNAAECHTVYTTPAPAGQVAQDAEQAADLRWLLAGKRAQLVWHYVLGVDEIDGHDSVMGAIRAARGDEVNQK